MIDANRKRSSDVYMRNGRCIPLRSKMADQGGKTRAETTREMSSNASFERPVPMKLFATWEVERTSPSCIPRLCSLTLTRLEVLTPLETNLNEVVISVSMQSSKRTLRSNSIFLPPSGLVDADLDLSFSLQYPHFLKRSGNNLQIMLQRRKKYKARAILGFKTLAVGLINMEQVLQYPVYSSLKLYAKGNPSPVAEVTFASLASQPVETDERGTSRRSTDERIDGDSSDDDDDYYSSDQDASDMSAGDLDTGNDILDDDERRRSRKMSRGKMRQHQHQRNLKQKFIALLKKFKVPDEVLAQQDDPYLDISPPENETGDDFLFDIEDIDDGDSDADNDFLMDTVSIISTPKPSLRPYFDPHSLTDLTPLPHPEETEDVNSFTDTKETITMDTESHQDTLTGSDQETSDSPVISDSASVQQSSPKLGSDSFSSKVWRSLSFRDAQSMGLAPIVRSNSDLELQQLHTSLNDQLSSVLPPDDKIPESVLMVCTAEWHGQLFALKLLDQMENMICTSGNADIQAVILAIVNKYQKFCNNHSVSPPCLRVAVAGTKSYIGSVLRPYVDQLASKPPEWQNFFRFLIIPFGPHPLAKFIAGMDPTYNSLFLDATWKEAFERSDSSADFNEIGKRVSAYISGASVSHMLPIAEALVTIKDKGSEESSSQLFLPFINEVKISFPEGPVPEKTDQGSSDEITISTPITGNSATQATSSTASKESPPPPSTQTVPSPVTSSPQKADVCIGGSGNTPPSANTELLDLQVDYWTVSSKKETNKSSLKTTFKSLVISRLPVADEHGVLSVFAVLKERNKRGFDAMKRLKKSKDKETESKNPITASVSKLICTTKGQNQTLNVVIDGTVWNGVKFFSLSSQWPTHIKNFPIGLSAHTETTC